MEIETYDYVGGMMHFNETFGSRISTWIAQNLEQVKPEEVDASGADALKVQLIIEAAIKSWETGEIITVEQID
jgi:hypothetical protein